MTTDEIYQKIQGLKTKKAEQEKAVANHSAQHNLAIQQRDNLVNELKAKGLIPQEATAEQALSLLQERCVVYQQKLESVIAKVQ